MTENSGVKRPKYDTISGNITTQLYDRSEAVKVISFHENFPVDMKLFEVRHYSHQNFVYDEYI
jgi:hypothetical protein